MQLRADTCCPFQRTAWANLDMIICKIDALHRGVLSQSACNLYSLIVPCIRDELSQNAKRMRAEEGNCRNLCR
jgi:hypothetical protein